MIKIIANQKIDLSKEEYEYYIELEKVFGKSSFDGLFKTNDLGQIIFVMPPPSNPTAMILIYYFLNVMLNQRLRKMEDWANVIDERIKKLEEK
jgi:hypothetical protein